MKKRQLLNVEHVPSKAGRTVDADKGVCLDFEQIGKRKDSGGNGPEDGHDDGTEDTGDQLWVSYEIHDTLDRVAGGDDHGLLMLSVFFVLRVEVEGRELGNSRGERKQGEHKERNTSGEKGVCASMWWISIYRIIFAAWTAQQMQCM